MFRRLHQQHPTSSEVPYFLGSCLLNEGQFESALNYFRISLKLNPLKDKNVHIYMAICYKALRDLPAAIQTLNQATEKNPQFEEAYFYKAKLYLKTKKYTSAILNFKKCISLNPLNELAHILLADSLRGSGKLHEALGRYEKVVILNGKQAPRALIKKIMLLLQINDLAEAESELKRAQKMGFNCPELKYCSGLLQFHLQNFNQASVFLELSLSESQQLGIASKNIKLLMQIAIKQKDFFGAEHLVSRNYKMGIKDEQNLLMCTLIEGINDLIKGKIEDSSDKLMQTLDRNRKMATSPLFHSRITESVNPYLAYCLFLQDRYSESLALYQKLPPHTELINRFNLQICEGVLLHRNNCLRQAENNFMAASLIIPNKIEPLFLNCINLVKMLAMPGPVDSKQDIFGRLEDTMMRVNEVSPTNSLFFFYKSLVFLFQGRIACQVIDFAVEKSDQEVSEYYFIKGLAYSLDGRTPAGLQFINKAIELDSSIPEFFKERSKYFYVLERYDEAIDDILKIIQDNDDDEEAKLLITFYYYMVGHYSRSLDLLTQLNSNSTADRFKDFEMALCLRMGKFTQCGITGQFVTAIRQKTQLSMSAICELQALIGEHCCVSEFTTYHFHLLLACYHCYRQEYDKCLDHLFGCLQEIQVTFARSEEYVGFSDLLLSEVKFNIVIVNLCRDCEDNNKNVNETFKYIDLFLSETDEQQFQRSMHKIVKAIKSPQSNSMSNPIHNIMMGNCGDKISSVFPQLIITLPNRSQISTRMMMMYPHKLKFNIAPEFDDSFLFNFDLHKVDTKLCPPWFNLSSGHLLFTEHITNHSLIMSEENSYLGRTPSLVGKRATPLLVGGELRDKFKLDEAVERRLDRLMRKGAKEGTAVKKSQSGNAII